MWNTQNPTPAHFSINFSFEHEIDYQKRLELSSGCVEIIETIAGLIQDIRLQWYTPELDHEKAEVLFHYIWVTLWTKSIDVKLEKNTIGYYELMDLKERFEELKESVDEKINQEQRHNLH